MNVYKNVVLPVLYGVAAVLVSIAAVVVVVGEVRGDGTDDESTATDVRASALADALRERLGEDGLPALRGFAERMDALPEQLDRTYLGVNVAEEEGAVVVQSVLPGGPAAEAGVQAGDTVRAVNGTAVATVDELRSALAAIEEGDTYTVDITRAGAEQRVSVQRMTMEDAMRAGIGRMFERFREHAPRLDPSGTPRPQT